MNQQLQPFLVSLKLVLLGIKHATNGISLEITPSVTLKELEIVSVIPSDPLDKVDHARFITVPCISFIRYDFKNKFFPHFYQK